MDALPPVDPRRRYDVATAAAYLAISRAWLFEKIKAGEIAPIRDGRRTFISGAEIERLCAPPQRSQA
jgi:excisionase family DNA binding protein